MMRRKPSVPVQETHSYSRPLCTHRWDTRQQCLHALERHRGCQEWLEGPSQCAYTLFNSLLSARQVANPSLALFATSSHYLKSCYLELSGIFVPIFPSIDLATTCAVEGLCLTISVCKILGSYQCLGSNLTDRYITATWVLIPLSSL